MKLGNSWVTSPPASDSAVLELCEHWKDGLPREFIDFFSAQNGARLDSFEIWSVEEILADPYRACEFGPHLVIFGTDYCGELFAFDLRQQPVRSVVMVAAISDWEEDIAVVAEDFPSFIGRLEHLAAKPGYTLLDPDHYTHPGPRLDCDKDHFRRSHRRWIHRLADGNTRGIGDVPHEMQCGGCRFYVRLSGEFRRDWGVCTSPASPRDGLTTFEHHGCEAFVTSQEDWS